MKRACRSIAVLLVALACIAGGEIPGRAETTYVIDTPNMGMLDYGAYNLNFRLFKEGGILTRLDFGVFKIVNLGVGWEVNRAIGDQDVTVSPPALSLKIRPFAGDLILPAIAFGYDGQGYFYDKNTNKYLQPEKGVFLVIGREIIIPGLELNLGGNISDFKTNTVYGFVNTTFNIENKLMLLAEYDEINYLPQSKLNLGVRIAITDDLGIDLAGRDIGAAGRDAERIIRINYLGRF
jgi:hypothetical protein